MDWLTFKFCVLIWMLCVSTSKSQSQLMNSTSSLSNQLRSACEDGQPVVSPDECNTCICFAGQTYCTNIPCPEQHCVNGVDVPEPDACNKCICRRGKLTCSSMVCIPAPLCAEKQLYPAQNKCNGCMCMNGFISCTTNACAEEQLPSTIPKTTTKKPKKKKKCIEGESLPGPGVKCIECFCQNGRKRCKDVCNPTLESRFGEVTKATTKKLSEEKKCIEGESLPGPGVKCIECFCQNGRKRCKNVCNPTLESRFGEATTKKPSEEKKCIEGESIPGPGLECIECYCQNGKKICRNVCNPTLESRFGEATPKKPNEEKKCIEGEAIPGPGLECIECYCQNGKTNCRNVCNPTLESRFGEATTKKPSEEKKCIEGESLPGPGLECIECFCQNGRKRCKNVCNPTLESRFGGTTTKKPNEEMKCIEGEAIPGPGLECIECYCQNGKKICRNVCNPTLESRYGEATTKKPSEEKKCIEGESLPGPGLECIECYCQNGKKSCKNVCNPTMESRFSEGTDITKATTEIPKKKKKKCMERDFFPGYLPCIECYCKNGRKTCKNICKPTVESRFSEVESLQMSEPECVRGEHIPKPDDCNNCICFEGKIHCTHLPCRVDIRIGPDCTDNQLIFRPDECNECYCFEGRLECSDLVCIRGSKCVLGQVIPKPDSCNTCKCIEGHILCTDHQCPILNSKNVLRPGRSSKELRTLEECQEGDIISPPPPPNDCNTCYCLDNRILCTMNICEGSDPEIKGRIIKPNQQTDLEIFDKQISVEPFINMLSNNYEKLPTKLIHTHAYNGFHQEIKVHASHLPKDATKLLKVLATSLDNAALASISQNLLTSTHSPSNIHDSKIPLDNKVVPTKLLGEENVLTTQSNKLITSGSRSNETILVIPNTESFDEPSSQSVLPLISKHETIWKSVSSPASLGFNNNQQIKPLTSQEVNPNVYYYDNPPSTFTSIDENSMIRNPSKFGRPGLPHRLPTKPTRNIVEIPNTNTQSIYPMSNPKSININDGKISYAPFSQETNQFKPIPSGLENNKFHLIPSGFLFKRDELPDHRPYQLIKPGHNQFFNYTSSPPIFRPGKFIVNQNNNGGQQKPSQSQFIPFSKFYSNHVKPQQIQFKPNQNHLPSLNNIQHPHLFQNNPNPPTVAANQYKKPQFGLKPGQGSLNPMNNKGNQTDQQFKPFQPNFQINSPLIKLPNQKKRISNLNNEGSKEIPHHSMVPNSTAHHTYILNQPQNGLDPEHTHPKSSQSQFVSNPSIFYRDEYEAPKIVDVNPDEEQLIPHTKISYKHSEYNSPDTSSESDFDTLLPKVRNKIKKYNTSHSHYEKHTSITYVSEYDPTHPANSFQIVHDPNQYQNAPLTDLYEHDLPDQESQELYPTMSKVNYYLNLPNKYSQYDSWNIKNHQFDTYPHSPSDSNNTGPLSFSQFILSQDNSKKGGLNDTKSAGDPQSLSNSAEDPTHPKSNKHLPPPAQTGPTQNQSPLGLFDDRGSTNGFQYAHNAYENPRQIKPFYKLLPSKLETPQNDQLPGFYDERGSADGYFQYPSNSAEDLTPPKIKLNKSPHFDPYTSIGNPKQLQDNQYISPNSQFGPTQKQHKPGVFDNREVKDGFQYAHNADKNPTHLKPLHKLLAFPHSHTPFDPILIQHSPEMFDERANADGFQYPFNSAENPIHSRGNLHNPKLIQFDPTQNQHSPGMFDERGSTNGFHYPSNSAENPLYPKDKLNKLLHIQFGPTQNQKLPGVFDERVSTDGFQYTSSSAENPAKPKENMHKPSNSPFGPTTYKKLPGMFDERGSSDGFQYPSNSAESPLHVKENIHISPNSPFGPTTYKHLPGMYSSNSAGNPTHTEQNKQKKTYSLVDPNHNKPTPGMFAGLGYPDSFQYSSNSAKNHLHPKENLHYLTHSQFGPPQTENLPGVFDNRGSPGGFQYPSHSAENPLLPKYNQYNPTLPQFGPLQNQHIPGVFDDHGSPDGFQYLSNSAENPTHLTQNKQIQPNSPFDPTQNQHLPGMFDERGSADGFQYPSHSAENPLHSRDNQYNPPHPQFGSLQKQHILGEFNERGSADAFHFPSNSAENPTHSTQNKQIQPNSPFGPAQNQHSPGMFGERGSADGFQYPSNSFENPTHPKDNLHKLPHSQFLPSPNQHTPGVFDDRGSADGFHYPSFSAEDSTHPKDKPPHSPFGPTQNQHLPGMFDERGSADGFQYTSHSAEHPLQPKDNQYNPPHPQFGPYENQHTPGVFDDRGTAEGFQHTSNSAENPTHPKPNKQIQPNSPFGPVQNQQLPGMFDNRGSADGFQYPSNSAENPTHPEDNLHKFPQSQFLPSPNQHTPGVLDDHGSANGFQYPSNSAERPTHPKPNKQIQPYSPFDPAQNQHLPGMFDERGSADGFQYPSNSFENPTHPKDNLHKLPQAQFLPSPNQHTPGIFDDRGSADSFHYPSISAEDSTHPKGKPPHFPLGPTQNQHLPGMFDERGSADGFQYPSHSAENPLQPKDNQHNPPYPQFGPNENQHTPGVFDDRGSADGFQYPSHSAESPLQPKGNQHNPPYPLFGPNENQHTPGVFDDRGSADGFQYPSHSAETPLQPKGNQHNPPYSQFGPNENQHTPGVFDDRGSADGFQYPSHSAESPLQPKGNQHNAPYPQFGPNENQHTPGVFDDRGSADGFQYPSHSAESPLQPKGNQHNPPYPQFGPNENQHTPGVFDDRGSADGFQYPSHSAESPLQPKGNQHNAPYPQFGPNENQHTPGVFDDRGSADGFQYPSHSAESPLQPKGNQHNPPYPQFGPNENQHTPGVFDDRGPADGFQYPSNSAENPTDPKNNPNPTPDSKFKQPQNQPKPSSLDDGYNNNNPLRPWMHLDHDQYKPSSFDNLLNGVHNIPWSVPNPDNNALESDAEITTPRSGFKPKEDQYGPSIVKNPSISNQNENTDLTNVDDNQLQIEQDVYSTELTDSDSTQYNLISKLKPDSDPGSVLLTDNGKIPDYYDQLYPLFKAVKKLNDPPIDDSLFSVGSMNQLDLLPFLFPGIAKILNYEPSQDKEDVSPDENHVVQMINPLSRLKSKLKKLPENNDGILNWLKSKFSKLLPTKNNATVTKNDIDMTKIFNLLSKLTSRKLKQTTVLQNIPFNGFDPEIIENIMNDFKEDILTTTSTPRTNSTHSYENRFMSVPTIPEESRPQISQLKYPDVHIILHQPNGEDDEDLPPYIETDGDLNLAPDIDSKELSASMLPKIFNPRFRHRPKDQKEECGDGTQWISNCHGCSCYFGQAMCFRLPDCELRAFGEPMTCKPYSHFKMGCYTCECNGDGVAECDATDCNTKPSRKSRVTGSTESPLPIFNEFFDSKKTDEILQYYNIYKKLPKDCSKQDLETQYPTCEPGTSWVSSCHKCECNESGNHECNKIDDCELDFASYGKPGQCKPNSKFYPKTNSMPCVECSCNDEGISYCPTADYKKH